MTIEEKLREMILDKFGTVVRFSKHIGISSSTIYSILTRGVQNASAQNILRICDALDISADALAEGMIKPRDQFTPSIELDDWLYAEKVHLMNVNITIDGKPLSDRERMALWDSLCLSAEFLRRHT